MSLLYSIIMHTIYMLLIPSAVFNNKARLWIIGRLNWRSKLEQWNQKGYQRYWFHAASLGEFEQGRPVMEQLKKDNPSCKIILTFFSPSGYEIRKNYGIADVVLYLPLDTRYNARKFIEMVRPDAVFFIKYEFWYFYLHELHRRHVLVYLVSGIFRKQQVFFRFYGGWYRKQLKLFGHLFVQDSDSADLLKRIGILSVSVTGDTRFDRVKQIATMAAPIETARVFSQGGKCVVAGSTWPPDESMLIQYFNESHHGIKMIMAPHEVDEGHIGKIKSQLSKESILYSDASPESAARKQVLIIDNIGMLSSLYQYGVIAYVGGGFGKGIHNILEASVYGIPVIFGPNYKKFREARELVAAGGAFSVSTYEELKTMLDRLITMPDFYSKSAQKAGKYTSDHTGATGMILRQLETDLNLHTHKQML